MASAGSRKSTQIVEEAVAMPGKRLLITTYTNQNVDQLKAYFIEKCGFLPRNVKLLSWFTFLLQDGVRPYQSFVTKRPRIEGIYFGELTPAAQYSAKGAPDSYFVNTAGEIFKDRVAEFVCTSDDNSGGLVLNRLNLTYDHIFIDELQDLAGYDLAFLQKVFSSSLPIMAVGDPRQATFSTNNSGKNKKFRRSGIADWIIEVQNAGLISVFEKNACYRCNQTICDFADALFPDLPKTKSFNKTKTGHDGVFEIKRKEVPAYVSEYNPIALKWNKSVDTMGVPSINIGLSKGRTFPRVLIFPTTPMKKYLKSKNIEEAGDISKLYVAVTRAQFSVAFVID